VRVPYAGIVTRAVAFVIDLLILNGVLIGTSVVVGLVISAFSNVKVDPDVGGVLAAGAVWSLAFAAYFITWWSLTGQTLGMRVLGIKVLTTKGDRLLPRRGLLRVIGMALAAIPLMAGYLPILVTDRRQGLPDFLARTVVVYVEQERPVPHRRAAADAEPASASVSVPGASGLGGLE
jgi:uncharacterized RDD family membrane protein YckC